ncbi:MAG: ribonuclease III [Neisseria sp.]|uniref:ribonuclease III n=1 Tax=Neisseria sp. TaxID=192066 RepID=UPI0026DC68F7|nr:ribonuclease III [Neisseria sp.]MDO4248985.1 ribonuclease III [Neisseria sp.]
MKTDPRRLAAMQRMQQQLGYQFNDTGWLQQALTHRSYSSRNNERLEFVGDSVLNYTVARMLFDAFPKLSEGELSRLRASLVNEATLAEIAIKINLGDCLYLGTGELKSGGFNRPSILADAMEAVFAAINFDADFQTAEKVVQSLFKDRIRTVDFSNQGKDAKTLLQEALQARRFALPKYRIEEQTGEGNEAQFVVSCDLGELGWIGRAQGNSRRLAEQAAAKEAVAWLEQNYSQKNKKK